MDELEEEAREYVTSPGSREELGASEAFLKTHTTIQKHCILFVLPRFPFGPEVVHIYWTHWLYQLEVIRTIKLKLVF